MARLSLAGPAPLQPHDRVKPYVVRFHDRIELHVPVLGAGVTAIVVQLDANDAASIAADLLAGLRWMLQTKAAQDAADRTTNA